MNIVLRRFDKTYGGYDYVEFNQEAKAMQEGNSRSHRGHFSGSSMFVEVATKKELRLAAIKLELEGYEDRR